MTYLQALLFLAKIQSLLEVNFDHLSVGLDEPHTFRIRQEDEKVWVVGFFREYPLQDGTQEEHVLIAVSNNPRSALEKLIEKLAYSDCSAEQLF